MLKKGQMSLTSFYDRGYTYSILSQSYSLEREHE